MSDTPFKQNQALVLSIAGDVDQLQTTLRTAMLAVRGWTYLNSPGPTPDKDMRAIIKSMLDAETVANRLDKLVNRLEI